jgi:hypothetical protein
MHAARSAGFSLVEALVATGLTMTVALGCAQLFSIAIVQASAPNPGTMATRQRRT